MRRVKRLPFGEERWSASCRCLRCEQALAAESSKYTLALFLSLSLSVSLFLSRSFRQIDSKVFADYPAELMEIAKDRARSMNERVSDAVRLFLCLLARLPSHYFKLPVVSYSADGGAKGLETFHGRQRRRRKRRRRDRN